MDVTNTPVPTSGTIGGAAGASNSRQIAEFQSAAVKYRAAFGDRAALAQLDTLASKGELGWGGEITRAIGKAGAWVDDQQKAAKINWK